MTMGVTSQDIADVLARFLGNEALDANLELLHKVLDEAAKLLISQVPIFKKIFLELVETVFVPRAVARQLAVLVALEAGIVTLNQVTSLVQSLSSNFSSRSRLIRQLLNEQDRAQTQDEWMDLAERIDNIQGNDIWRTDPNCALYERDRISARIDEYVHLMRRRDIFELMFVLRGSIGRSKFGLLHEGLFSKALAGTKVLVETYHNVVCAALDFVCDAPVPPDEDPIPTDARLAFFNETRHSYGRTALLLSGGAALGFYHVGVVKALMENRLMPRVIGGSSAGSIVCAMIGTRTDEECLNDMFHMQGTDAPGHSGKMPINFFRPLIKSGKKVIYGAPMGKEIDQVTEDVVRIKGGFFGPFREVYYNTAGAFHDAKRTLQAFVPIPLRHMSSLVYDLVTGNRRPQDIFKNDTEHFRECLRHCVGNFTFQEAFDRTGRILNIVVTPNNSSDPPRLLNYLTAPHVLVWSAAVASSSLPGVFEANRLVVKEADGWERYESGGGQHFSDGSMEQDLPMQQLSEMFNINHFIISQANPHAVMLGSYNHNTGVWTNPVTGMLSAILSFLKDQVRSWLMHMVQFVGARRIAPLFETQRGVGMQFFTQEYEGRSTDISLVPWRNHRSLFSALLHIIYNPNKEEFLEMIKAAERETWTYIPAIKSHIAEEITLDRCVQRLRKRLVQESWEKGKAGVSTRENIGDRVPSFFKSPSIVKLSGLGIADQPSIGALPQNTSNTWPQKQSVPDQPAPAAIEKEGPPPAIKINHGWGGLGLKGNRSSGNLLERSPSNASGLFIDDEEPQINLHQDAGEKTEVAPKKPTQNAIPSSNSGSNLSRGSQQDEGFDNKSGYVKTTSMARFYYRKTGNNDMNWNDPYDVSIRKTTSDPAMDNKKKMGEIGSPNSNENGADDLSEYYYQENQNVSSHDSQTATTTMHRRRKSKSVTDLKSVSLDGAEFRSPSKE